MMQSTLMSLHIAPMRRSLRSDAVHGRMRGSTASEMKLLTIKLSVLL